MSEALGQLPPLIASHLLLSLAALGLALAVGLPLGLAAAGRPGLRRVALGFAGLVQTIPGLALLALFYPLLLALSALVGGRVPALGFLPSLLALSLYALLPILRNVVAGLTGIDPAVIQAADGIGMTPAQKLRLVQLPLAAPVAMAGIRTAAVWTIGAATLATTVGYPSLGNPIFAGLQTENWTLVLAGCVAAAGLALAVDALLGLVERGLATGNAKQVWSGAGLLAAGLALVLAPALAPRPRVVTIGAKNFSEQYILARLIGARLERAGYRVAYREGLGSAVAFRALAGGDIDVYVDYSGTLWTGAMGRRDRLPRADMNRAIAEWMAAGPKTGLVGALGFENAYALAMRQAVARAKGIATIDDLARAAPGMTLGADLEFLDRPEWAAIRDAYRLRFAATRAYNPTFMYRALGSGQADVISAFSSDGRIAADGLTVLADPKGAVPAYDALLLVAPARVRDARLLAALRPLVGAIPVERMRRANYMVDRDAGKASPEAAAAWLARGDTLTAATRSQGERRQPMPRGSKDAYTDKQKREAAHIAEGYEKRGVPEKQAEARAWATVNKNTGGGNKSGSGRGKADTNEASKQGGRAQEGIARGADCGGAQGLGYAAAQGGGGGVRWPPITSGVVDGDQSLSVQFEHQARSH